MRKQKHSNQKKTYANNLKGMFVQRTEKKLAAMKATIETISKDSYTEGFNDGKAEGFCEGVYTAQKNPLVVIGDKLWFRYNIGAVSSGGSVFDESFTGKGYTYDEARDFCARYGVKLPSLEDLNSLGLIMRYNVSTSGCWWNKRATNSGICFEFEHSIWIDGNTMDDKATVASFRTCDCKPIPDMPGCYQGKIEVYTRLVLKGMKAKLHPYKTITL